MDLLVRNADVIVTMDQSRRELVGGWIALDDGVVAALGEPGREPRGARRVIDASGCVVTPGLVNTHHHLFQNLTRSYVPALSGDFFDWVRRSWRAWSRLDEEAVYVSAWVGMAELALGGSTTTADHLFVHTQPRLIDAEIRAAQDFGMRFHAVRGAVDLSEKSGGLAPDPLAEDPDDILADCKRLVGLFHDRSPTAMVRVALGPSGSSSASEHLMRAALELGERLDVRLHTHLAEDPLDTAYCLEHYGRLPVDYFADLGWGCDRVWVAHCIYPAGGDIERLARWGTAVAHCPSAMMICGGPGITPVREMLDAGVTVGLGCDGAGTSDHGSLWLEARTAMLAARVRGTMSSMSAREALEMATLGGAACLGRQDEIGVLKPGACGDLVVWSLRGPQFAGAVSDPVEGLLRSGPVAAHWTVVAGRVLVEDGQVVVPGLGDMLARHRKLASRMQDL